MGKELISGKIVNSRQEMVRDDMWMYYKTFGKTPRQSSLVHGQVSALYK